MEILPKPVSFDWDKGNIDKNLIKHNVGDKESEEAFNDKRLKIFKDAGHSQDEQRFVAYGITYLNRKLAIVFTIRSAKIRVISARDQNTKERTIYEQKNKNNT